MINAVISGHPGVIFGLHVCRGNDASRYMSCGGKVVVLGLITTKSERMETPGEVRRRIEEASR